MRIKAVIKSKLPSWYIIQSPAARIKCRRYVRRLVSSRRFCRAERSDRAWRKFLSRCRRVRPEFFAELSEKDAADRNLLRCCLTRGFTAQEYHLFGLAEKDETERAAYLSDIDRYILASRCNDITQFVKFTDKALLYQRFKPYYRREAVCIASPEDYDVFCIFSSRHPTAVVKPVGGQCGRGIYPVNIPTDETGRRAVFAGILAGGRTLAEEPIRQSKTLAALHPDSVNTVRLAAFRTRRGIVFPFAFLKAGRGDSFVDNAGAGGIVCGIDPADGRVVTDGFDEAGGRFLCHPDSGVALRGFVLPVWQELLALCRTLSEAEPDMGYIAWDFAHTADGWVLVEGNSQGQLIIPQLVHERGFAPDLRAVMKEMRLWV